MFPALREELDRVRVHLIGIDLRWGVTREQAENDQVLALCLRQIDECRPFFVGILGERYGWVPSRHPVDAMKQYGWVQHHTGKSVTELEIVHGVLQNPAMRSRAFFYFRDPAGLRAVPEAVRRAVYAESDPDRAEKLAELKRRIRFSGHPVTENYPAQWDPTAHDPQTRSRGRLVGLEEFGRRVREQLRRAIREEFGLGDSSAAAPDPLTEEDDFHERCRESRLRVYVGRAAVREELARFARETDDVTCLVTGPSGSGKSAALADFVATLRRDDPGAAVFPHFVGAGPRSTGLRDLLRRLCAGLKGRFGFPDELPDEVTRLATTFRDLLGKIPSGARAVLVVDALDQLDAADRARHLWWLPARLPPAVRVVVSCAHDSGRAGPVLAAFDARPRRRVEVGPLGDAERRAVVREVPSLSAKALDADQVNLLLDNPATANPLFLLVALEELRGFGSYEQLNERIAALPSDGDTVTALFTQVIDRLEADFDAETAGTVLTLLASARRGLSERELQDLVGAAAGRDDLFSILRQLRPYLLSRGGLLDFYHRNLARAVREKYLGADARRAAAHARLAAYFGDQDDFLESPAEQRARATRVPPAPRPANVRKVDELPWHLTAVATLAGREGQGSPHWDAVADRFTSLHFLEAKAEAGAVFELAADLAAALEALPAGHPRRRALELLEEALRLDAHLVAAHPTTLFQCLWNRCWWYDSPAAAAHYLPPPGGWPAGGPPWESTGTCLSALLEWWRGVKEQAQPGVCWARALRPPPLPLGSPLRRILRGHRGRLECVAFSPDGRLLASAGNDCTARVWEVATRALLLVLAHDESVNAVAFSPDGRRLVTCGYVPPAGGNEVRLWDVHTGSELASLPARASCKCLAFFPDDRRVAIGTDTCEVLVWDTTGADELLRWGDIGEAHCLAISPDGLTVATGGGIYRIQTLDMPEDGSEPVKPADEPDNSEIGTLRVWDTATGALRYTSRGHTRGIVGLGFTADGRRLVSAAGDACVRVWDAESGIGLPPSPALLPNFSTTIQGVVLLAATAGGGVVVCAGVGFFCVWDLGRGEWAFTQKTLSAMPGCVGVSGDGRTVATATADGEIHVWSTDEEAFRPTLHDHPNAVRHLRVDPTGRRLASFSEQGLAVRVWALESGEPTGCFFADGAVRACSFRTVAGWRWGPTTRSPSRTPTPGASSVPGNWGNTSAALVSASRRTVAGWPRR